MNLVLRTVTQEIQLLLKGWLPQDAPKILAAIKDSKKKQQLLLGASGCFGKECCK